MSANAHSSRRQETDRFATDPTAEGWEMWTSTAVFLGVGDVEAMLKSPPSMIPKQSVDCWRDIRKASISKESKLRDLGAKTAARCGAAGDLSTASTLGSLAALGDLDAAFTLAGKQTLNTSNGTLAASGLQPLFWPSSRAKRADPRFLPLVEKLGLMEYWTATKTQPDVCETEDVPFCRELKQAAQP